MHPDVESLAREIEAVQGGDPWRETTVLCPTPASAVQARRALVRHAGRAVGLHWSTPPVYRRMTCPRALPSPARRAVATWRTLNELFPDWLARLDATRLLQTFRDAFARIDDDPSLEDMTEPRVRSAYGHYRRQLPTSPLPDEGTPRLDPLLLYRTVDEDPLITCLGETRRMLHVPTVSYPARLRAQSHHDAHEEARAACSLIRDRVLAGAPAWRCAVMIPERDYYGRLVRRALDCAELEGHGAPAVPNPSEDLGRTMRRIAGGIFESWLDVAQAMTDAVDGNEEEPAHLLRSHAREWRELDVKPHPALLSVLVHEALRDVWPGSGRYGDGPFVGTLDALEGTDWELLVVVGFTDRAYPIPRLRNPLLPPEAQDELAQEAAFDRLVGRSEEAVALFPRGDRLRNGPAFASAWLQPRLREDVEMVGSPLGARRAVPPVDGTDVELARAFRRAPETLPEGHAARLARRGPSEGLVQLAEDLLPGRDRPWSPTGLESFLRCPRRYYYGRILQIPEPATLERGLPAAERGRIAHEVLQLFFRDRADRLERGESWTLADEEEIRRWPLGYRDGLDAGVVGDLRSLGVALAQTLRADSTLRAETGAIPRLYETPFAMEVEGIPIHGAVDRVDLTHAGEAVVVDYKTGWIPGVRSRAGDPSAGGRLLQWLLYADWAAQDGAVSVETIYLPVGAGKPPARIVYEEAARTRLVEWVHAADRLARERLIPVRPGQACLSCPYTEICPSDRDRVADRQRSEAKGTAWAEVLRLAGEEVADDGGKALDQ